MLHTARFLPVIILTIPGLAQETELLETARLGDLTKLKALTGNSANIDLRDAHHRTALHQAAANCQLEAAKLLVDAGWDRRARDSEGRTPAMLAMQCPDRNTAAVLSLLLTSPMKPAAGVEKNPWSLQAEKSPW